MKTDDILDSYQPSASRSPDVLVGPDSIPTLSFTSGSEGRPKGVQGRHFSLTHYFPWMAAHFALSERDRFTMLSGIAHDPIQRDMFTPLFLGAQIYIPSVEDIAHGKLAEWASRYEVTVTHLTPAMGQILVGGATMEMPSLRRAFFVGDVLTKRDCRALQRLAPHTSIINMFGTTETQRAVSYFEIPSTVDDPMFLDGVNNVVPAGRGMKNVQLLVVNREDRTKLCGIGESGEIYVRAAGLAQGYLGLPELNREKFLQNWFTDAAELAKADQSSVQAPGSQSWREHYMGPRDRLYRSGDLGRYTANGDVECTGRADNQIKIRGFRIELGEIDTHLSSHPLIRENVTLVRRDKAEEMQLISYIVINKAKWLELDPRRAEEDSSENDDMVGLLRRYRDLRAEIRSFLKTKLPAYAVPSIIIPLTRMPLNPNGKPDRPALPFPEAAELAAAGPVLPSASLVDVTETEQKVAAIWANYLSLVDASTIGPDDSFFDIGGHSILAQRMLLELRRTWPVANPNIGLLLKNPTLRGLSDRLDDLQHGDSTVSDLRNGINGKEASAYYVDAEQLASTLPTRNPQSSSEGSSHPSSILLTGATGFLGSYILHEIASQYPALSVTVLVRASDAALARSRLQTAWDAYKLGDLPSKERLSVLCGDLSLPHYGLTDEQWTHLEDSIDTVVHNGAWVHWVYPYTHLRASNVISTIEAIKLCARGKPKTLTFVSSTSVLDTPHYLQLSQQLLHRGAKGIPEADDLTGSKSDLGTGYGQTKWVSEYLLRKLGQTWLRGRIIRPGYILGDSNTGVTNTDDFLIRMMKAVCQLGKYPLIENGVNAVPVDQVARIVVCSAMSAPESGIAVAQVDAPSRLTLTQIAQGASKLGYSLAAEPYEQWKLAVEKYVNSSQQEEFALLPLLEFIMGDLPADTKAPVLDCQNTLRLLKEGGKPELRGVDIVTLDKYVADLFDTGFLVGPDGKSSAGAVDHRRMTALKSIGGRSGIA